jgi:flagellar basal-body rod protein FlgF
MDATSYVTLSAQIALEKQLDTVANNVANTSTSGFKADRPLFQSYIDRVSATPNDSGVAFVQDAGTYIDRSSGSMENTGNPMDIALDGQGYLGVNTPDGPMYSRDGHLKVGADNTLLGAGGLPVLGSDGSPIQIPDGYAELQIKADGSIKAMVNQRLVDVAQIGVFKPDDPNSLRKDGNGLLTAPQGTMQPVTPNDGGARVVQGSLEGSTVKPMVEIANMTELSRAYDRLNSLLSDENDREQKMIDTLSHSN